MHENTGLRERKKAETRAAISKAVMGLAVERGLDGMTSDDIAAAANVSVRTFHNYFGSKEEALVAAWRSEFQTHVDALRDRPADEPILISLEHVFAGIAAAVLQQPDEAAASSTCSGPAWSSRSTAGPDRRGHPPVSDVVAAGRRPIRTDVYPPS